MRSATINKAMQCWLMCFVVVCCMGRQPSLDHHGVSMLQALADSMVVTRQHFTRGLARVRPSSLRGISPEVPTAAKSSVWCPQYST